MVSGIAARYKTGIVAMIDTAELRLSLFEPLVGCVFQTHGSGCDDSLELVDAAQLKDLSGHGRSAGCFRLTFHGASTEITLGQGLYLMRHEALGEMVMTLVPHGRLENGTVRYSATFS
jgi:hypothetical protein